MAAGLRIPAPTQHLADAPNAWLTPNSASSCVPGPGRYKERQSFHEETTGSPSQGMLGTGGFASRSKRFTSYVSTGPGPQKYKGAASLPGFTGYYFTRSPSLDSMYENDSPGPAKYGDNTSSISSPGVKDCSSVFSPGNEREVTCTKEPDPPRQQVAHVRPLASQGRFTKSCGAFFNEPARKRDALPHPRLPTGSDCFMRIGVMRTAELPGPGEYEQAPLCWSGTSCGMYGTSAFQPSGLSSFIPSASGPGPGRYDPKRSQSGNGGGAQPVFRSTAQRIKHDVGSAPGPAFYSPSKPKKSESWQVNTRGRWI